MSSRHAKWAMAAETGSFDPSSLSKVTAWLRHTQTSSDLTTWSSMLDANHATANAARAPAAGTSAGNARPIATWTSANNDAMAWALNSANGSGTEAKWWVRFWARQPSSGLETPFCIFNGTNGASARKVIFQFNTTQRVAFGVYDSGAALRTAMTNTAAFSAGAWIWVAGIFDGSATGDARIILKIGGNTPTLNYSGAGTPPATLNAATGNAVIGNLNDGVSSTGLNGSIGPDIFVGAGSDDLTAQEDANLMAFDQPT